jgi:hypothetical protein
VSAGARPLISYIAPSAPATRRRATGALPFLRPEVGFTPGWYREKLGVDFGQRWHTDVGYRREALLAMRAELRRRFPGTAIGGVDRPDHPLDLLTGVFGTCGVAAIYGVPIVYARDGWPDCERRFLTDREIDSLEPADLDASPFFRGLMAQVEEIAASGPVEGYINWQGVLNNAHRLRGEQLFYDMADRPDRARHLFDCVCATMIEAAGRLHARQSDSGVTVDFFTVSNCLVNLVSPAQYAEQLLPCDRRLAETFGALGVHNCAWTADAYLEHYAKLPDVQYIDMGLGSDLRRAREAFPRARRALMYTPMDLANKTLAGIGADLERIAREYAPCDLVVADIEADTPDERVRAVLDVCAELSATENR